MMLGAVLPEMRRPLKRSQPISQRWSRVREDIARERETLTASLGAQAEDRQRITALMAERQRRQGEVEKTLETERQNALQLAKQADNLKDLIARLEHGSRSGYAGRRGPRRA